MKRFVINSDDALLYDGIEKITGILAKERIVMSQEEWLAWGKREKTGTNSVIFIHYFHKHTDIRDIYRSLIMASRDKRIAGQLILVEQLEDVFKAMSEVIKNLVVLNACCSPESLMVGIASIRDGATPFFQNRYYNVCGFGLSPAQKDVALKLGSGMSQAYVGKISNLSNKTISLHKRGIFKKLGLNNHYDFYRFTILIRESTRI